ncbi:o-succinylbenzoate--CoA ligase [Virgibacillus sp. W0430]|uniref:o-succinylbenzoate--CoA ligase n=1 Tax=Virgibacillus sp. W0430 TaxID=3391580 RepID=UPI003F48C278
MSQAIPHWLDKQAALVPNKIAIEQANREPITFLELKEKSELVARKLAQLNVKKDTHVGILAANRTDIIIAVYALSYLQAVAVLLNTRLAEAELNYQIKDAALHLLIISEEADRKYANRVQTKTFQDIYTTEEKNVMLKTELNLEQPFTMMYTSGTTGRPKAVIHTYGNYWWSAVNSSLNLGMSHHDKWLVVLPMFHIGGLSIFIRSVIYGTAVYLVEKFDEKVVHEAIMKRNVTIMSVVTVMLQKLMEELGDDHYPNTFRCMLLGGGPAPKVLLERAQAKNIPVFQSYGMTETTAQIAALNPSDALTKLGSSGKPLLSADIKISEPGEDSVGEIFVKGPMVTNGYYNRQLANKNLFKAGWLATGDMGYLDEEGYLYVVDRRKDLIISGGENIYPSEIEQILTRVSGVKEAAVIGKANEVWGEVPVAFIVASNNTISAEKISSFAKKHLAKYKCPKEIHFIEQLPRNASNKLVRTELHRLL